MSRKVAPLVALSFAFMLGVTVWSAQNPAQTTGVPVAAGNNDPRLATLDPKVRQMVLEEADAAKVGCEGSAIDVYECDCYAREVVEERLRIGTAVRTLKSATREITGFAKTMDPGAPTGIGACVSTAKTEKYGREQATGLQLNPSSVVGECAGRELAVRFKKLPRPSTVLIQPLLIEAMQFCRRSLPPGAATTPTSMPAAPAGKANNPPPSPAPQDSTQPQSSVPPPPAAAAAGANSSSNATASPAPATPELAGTPAPAEKASAARPGDTLGERQAKIQSDVAERTKALTEELRQKAQGGQSAAVTPLGAPWQPCGGTLRSTQSQKGVAVEFVNSSSQPRKLYWMDFGGMRQLYGTLQPGQRAPMQTYATHSWMVADDSDRCLGTIVIAGPARLEIR